jgi:dienelactone hydrolase
MRLLNEMTRRVVFACRNSLLLAVVLLAGFPASIASAQARRAGPWDVSALSNAPAATWGATTGLVQELYYEGEPLKGKSTRIFAYLGRPTKSAAGRQPGMVLVHGGGGKAFKAWAEHWAERGYVAIAMDLAGKGPNGPLPDGGPDQSDTVKFREFTEDQANEMWSYHAVAAVLRAHSLLRSLPEVDAERIGLTGISWGGYLTCIVAGIDPRFKVAVPVYGCGFLGDNSVWKDGSLAAMSPAARALWLRLFDPRQYLGNVRYPMLFVNGTTDFAYPLDSYQKSYRLVPEKWRHVSVAIGRKHGHIWTFPEVDAFVDGVLKAKPSLAWPGKPVVKEGTLSATLDRPAAFTNVLLCYTTNSGVWQKRTWQSEPARLDGKKISAELPAARPIVAFLGMTDAEGRYISTEHVELLEK